MLLKKHKHLCPFVSFCKTEESTTVTTKDGKRFQPHASRIIGRRARWLVTTVVYLEQEKLLALDKDGI